MSYLVIGATGQQGASVVKHLANRNVRVRALTRDPDAVKARALTAAGIDVVGGDLRYPHTLDEAFSGVSGVFSVQDFYAPGAGIVGEIAQGRAVIEAARRNGVTHIVQSTMGDCNAPGGPPHFLSKALLERELLRSGLDVTLLGTVWFLDNLLNPAMKPDLIFPVLSGSLSPATRFPMLALDDLGWIAAEALTDPGRWAGRKINLAGDILTVAEMKQAYRQVTGKRPKTWRLPAWMLRRFAPEFAEQLAWHNRVNFSFGSEPLRRERPQALSFAEYIARQRLASL